MEKLKKYIILVIVAIQNRTWPKSLQLFVEVRFVFGEIVGPLHHQTRRMVQQSIP